jgi:DDE family transposase
VNPGLPTRMRRGSHGPLARWALRSCRRCLPAQTRGWRGQPAYVDAAHRVHARVEDAICTGKDTGLGKYPSTSLAMNKAWQAAALTAATLLAWIKLLALDTTLAKAEPKTLRYRLLHAAARMTRGGRQRRLNIAATWPWAADIITAWDRISALPQAP